MRGLVLLMLVCTASLSWDALVHAQSPEAMAEVQNIVNSCAEEHSYLPARALCIVNRLNDFMNFLLDEMDYLLAAWEDLYAPYGPSVICMYAPEVCQPGGLGYELQMTQWDIWYVGGAIEYWWTFL